MVYGIQCFGTTSVVLPLLKSGQSPTEVSSYRILALFSCVVKTLERLVKARFKRWLENHDLPPTQFGFRRGRSCADNLALLLTEVIRRFNVRGVTTVVFADVTRAYDVVC